MEYAEDAGTAKDVKAAIIMIISINGVILKDSDGADFRGLSVAIVKVGHLFLLHICFNCTTYS